MILLAFQISLLSLIVVSFLMVVSVPVVFASPNSWENNRNFIFLGSLLWTILLLTVGFLNYLVV
jgi:photosystem II PsbZ protein